MDNNGADEKRVVLLGGCCAVVGIVDVNFDDGGNKEETVPGLKEVWLGNTARACVEYYITTKHT